MSCSGCTYQDNCRKIKKFHNSQTLFITLFFLFYPNTSYSQFEIGNGIKHCLQAFSVQKKEVASRVERIIKSSAKGDMNKIWEEIPFKLWPNVAQQIFSETDKTSDDHKLLIAQVIVESLQEKLQKQSNEGTERLNLKNIGLIYEVLFNRVIFDFSTLKWRQENKNKNNLRGKVVSIKNQIYGLFEQYPQYIPIKVLRKLARGVTYPNPIYTKNEKINHIRILSFSEKKVLKDVLTIQILGGGINDFNPEVRKDAVEFLGQILSKRLGLFDRGLLNILTQKPLNYLLPLVPLVSAYAFIPKELFFILDTLLVVTVVTIAWPVIDFLSDSSKTSDIRWHISEQLYKAAYDPDIEVRKSAFQSIGQMKTIYPFLIDALIEAIAFSSEDKVKKQALNSLRDSLEKIGWAYFLSGFIYEERKKENVINSIVAPLYKDYDNRNEYRSIILDFLERKKRNIQPKEYRSVQDKKAEELEAELKRYKEKNIKTIRKSSKNNEPPPFDSWFEVEVFLELHKNGYIVLPQFPFQKGNASDSFYYIDLVVLDSQNPKNRLAIECDGPPHNEREQQEEDKEKQRFLESKGWTVQRIKHSEETTPSLPYPSFYSSYSTRTGGKINAETLDRLLEELERNQIKPVK